nr:ammonia channel protein [Hyphomicrobium sp.]
MKLALPSCTGRLAGAAAALALMAVPAMAADAPVPNKADTVFMFLTTVLVLLMTVPGLA